MRQLLCCPRHWLGRTFAFAAEALPTDQFVQKVAISDQFEIESGQLATKQAEGGAVKSFGQRMADDHTKTTNQLSELVKQSDINAKLPNALDDQHQVTLNKLKDLAGKDFDRTYVSEQVNAHEKAVDLFQAYADSGENEKLKQWAQATLPTLKQHLKEAQALNIEVGQTPVVQDSPTRSQERAEATDQTRSEKDVKKSTDTLPSKIKYVTRQAPTDWSAEALIGRTVENFKGENLGDINNVILNEKGDVVAVTIGVGGFLGLGEKDVGVPFDALEFRTEKDMAEQSNDTKTKETREERAEEAREARAARYDTEHADIQVILDATREQLESAPAFVWLDQQTLNEKKSEQVPQ